MYGRIIVHRIRKLLGSRSAGAAGLLLVVIAVNSFSLSSCGRRETVFIPAEEIGARSISDLSGDGSAEDPGAGGETEADSAASPGEEEITSAEPGAEEIYVHVCGAVVSPGVYVLRNGARGYEAVEAAGGLDEEAADTAVNLAARLGDGSMLRIPYVFEVTADPAAGGDADPEGTAFGGAPGDPAVPSGESAAGEEPGKININLASLSELTTLTGIGEAKAQAIIDYREEHGGFRSISEITRVSGIGSVIYGKIRDDICVE